MKFVSFWNGGESFCTNRPQANVQLGMESSLSLARSVAEVKWMSSCSGEDFFGAPVDWQKRKKGKSINIALIPPAVCQHTNNPLRGVSGAKTFRLRCHWKSINISTQPSMGSIDELSLKGIRWPRQKLERREVASGMFRAEMFALIELTVEMSGLIGQQTKVVFVVLDFLFNVFELAGYAAASITREAWAERVRVAKSVFSIAAAVLQILIRSWREEKFYFRFGNAKNFLINFEKRKICFGFLKECSDVSESFLSSATLNLKRVVGDETFPQLTWVLVLYLHRHFALIFRLLLRFDIFRLSAVFQLLLLNLFHFGSLILEPNLRERSKAWVIVWRANHELNVTNRPTQFTVQLTCYIKLYATINFDTAGNTSNTILPPKIMSSVLSFDVDPRHRERELR